SEHAENRQGRMGASIWERPDYYIENSPVYYADKVNTPLMMIANKFDHNVDFTQDLEFFTALRRLGKRVWMLQYDKGGHGVDGDVRMDYLIRSQQFFDHYLKGAPAPKWMVEGVPAAMKQVDNGLELEPPGVKPGPGLLTPEARRAVDALEKRKPITVTFN
ncbi:MAG: prolyl oligopeptidase family serine peptidase, partial [Bacteroidota bacterium]|nr:prolyl oligopeptidase family serine peptidase [Bacteroidota bacterium]